MAEKTKRLTFSKSEVRDALQTFAHKIGDTIEFGAIKTITANEDDGDFCDMEIDSLAKGIHRRKVSISVVGAAMLNFCSAKNIALPKGAKRLIIGDNSEVHLEIDG